MTSFSYAGCFGLGLCLSPAPTEVAKNPQYKVKILESMKIVWMTEIACVLFLAAIPLIIVGMSLKEDDADPGDKFWVIAYIGFILLGLGCLLYIAAIVLACKKKSETGVPVWKQVMPLMGRLLSITHIRNEFKALLDKQDSL